MKNCRFDVAVSFVLLLVVFITTGCKDENNNYFQGYVEGEYLHISSPIGGKLEELNVAKGMNVAQEAPLFSLDKTIEKATVAEAEQNL